MTGPTFAAGATVTVYTATVSGKDADNNNVTTYAPRLVSGVAFWPEVGGEQVDGRDLVTVRANVLLPPGDPVTVYDRVQVGSDLYDVTGPPQRFQSPFTGFDPGVQVSLTRISG